jgi:hypothetical protein
MSSNVNTSCKALSADISWTTGFHGGDMQQFYVLVQIIIGKDFNTKLLTDFDTVMSRRFVDDV